VDLYALSEAELSDQLQSWGQPAYRARQIRRWLYVRGARSVDEMTDLPLALRERLSGARFGAMEVATEQRSGDGTIKRLYRLDDKRLVESVLMPYDDGRRTACISSQVGCAMGCVFCATGQMGFVRQLSEAEIFAQAARFAAELTGRSERLSNVVLMGMGEPFHNYQAVLSAVRRIRDDLGIGARKITVSTVGLVPHILKFAEEGLEVGLAISLHAATDAERGRLLPVNRRWNIETLLNAVRTYVDRTGRRVTFEWALIAGENDTLEQADALGKLLRGLLCHVNLIPLNPTGGFAGGPSAQRSVGTFVDRLKQHGVSATVRVRRGIDIDAGCGQLRSRQAEADNEPDGSPST
jgi:23S rRNA (adenine2503-C2)-methyltransferase